MEKDDTAHVVAVDRVRNGIILHFSDVRQVFTFIQYSLGVAIFTPSISPPTCVP
jgi:hypothetical protein